VVEAVEPVPVVRAREKEPTMMECFRCGDSGHFVADCPLQAPAASHDEHLARIDACVAQWIAGQITTRRKRQLIADENRQYYGDDCRPVLLKTT
jgi:Zinc knuckle